MRSIQKIKTWCPPLCEPGMLSGKMAVNRTSYGCNSFTILNNDDLFPEDSLSCGGCNQFLNDGVNSYDWTDIFDQTLTIKKATNVYELPTFNSALVKTLYPGDQISIFSYVNFEGVTWLQVYFPPKQYPDWVPLTGTPAGINTVPVSTINSIFNVSEDVPTILTTEEKENQNADAFDKAGDLIKTVLVGAGALILVNKFL